MPFNPQIPFDASIHQGDRQGHDIVATVLHFTAGASAQSSIAWTKNPASQASWHFIIDRDGQVSQQVELSRAAWHAGAAQVLYHGSMTRLVNQCTIGIELANLGMLHQNADGSFASEAGNTLVPYHGPTPVHAQLVYANGNVLEGFWEPFADAQMDRLQWLLRLLADNGYGRAVGCLLGHEEVATPVGRKSDPGAAFDWPRLGRPNGTRMTDIRRVQMPVVS